MVTRWSRSTSNFYTLIGQNLTDKFVRKMYAASWDLFTLIAEADRVLCQFVMFLTVFFHWMYKMKHSCYQECSVIWDFGCEMRRFSQSRKSDFRWHRFRFSPYSMRKRGFKILSDSGLTWQLSGAASRMVSLSKYCIWYLFFLYLISWSRGQFLRQVYARL